MVLEHPARTDIPPRKANRENLSVQRARLRASCFLLVGAVMKHSKNKKGDGSDGGAGPDKNEVSPWGYKKTDKKTWWTKGGPRPKGGRPKGAKNKKTLWHDAFSKKIEVVIDGIKMKLSKDALSYHLLANKCMAGDIKAIALKLQWEDKFADPVEPAPTTAETDANLKVLEDYINLHKKFSKGESPAAGGTQEAPDGADGGDDE
ncbi:MAG: DUF5681 domain-containing protein [Sphingosinicella sp.]|uniref:DUF5681 domain-containing protein n=1 Tax=Sphingosinicella sp. TaxID=1917971 RepID=UPI004037862A